MSDDERPTPLGLLDVLVGEWTQLVSGHGDPTGTITFEWSLDARYLLQRSTLPARFPESLVVIEYDEAAGEFRGHYFDSRGVTRIYRMTLTGSEWMLLRTEPDFSELGLAQRFVGIIADDGRSVDGRWEQSPDGGNTWELDFGLRLERQP
ncbi:MAG: hypothetical protein J2P22_17525 [Nocardioides sp.]|nr:hypothetical protein [Nocardioides sp.]